MNYATVVTAVAAVAIIAACLYYLWWVEQGADILRKMFFEGRLGSISLYAGVSDAGKKTWELRLRAAGSSGAEVYYLNCWTRKPVAPIEDADILEALTEPLKGYAAWQIAYFARNLALLDSSVYFEKTTKQSRGADGWYLAFKN